MESNRIVRLVIIAVVAGLIPIVFLIAYSRIVSSFEERENRLSELQQEEHRHNLNIAKAKLAIKRLRTYQQRALSSDSLTARASLQSWLVATAEEFFIPDTVLVRPLGNRTMRDQAREQVGEQISFRVSARGDLKQLTGFLHRFYSMNTLHRIATLNVKPREDSKLLDLVFIVDALSLAGAMEGEDSEQALAAARNQIAMTNVLSATAIGPFASVASAASPVVAKSSYTHNVANKLWRDIFSNEAPERFAYTDNSYEDYADLILTRNLFGEVNSRPEFASIRPSTGTTDRRYSLQIKASDPDEFDRLQFSLIGEAPDDANLLNSSDGDSATLTFTPPEAGQYEFTVSVADDGLPSKRVEETFTVTVNDPKPPTPKPTPPPPPKFDFAKYTEVQAFLRGRDGTWEVWLHVKPRDEAPLELNVGDTFEIGSVKGRIQDIGPTSVIIEVNGEPRRFGRGEVLTAGSPPPEV